MATEAAAATTTAGSKRTMSARLLHAASLASTASSDSFRVHTRALRPVAASIISYGRSSKIPDRTISKTTTLYVMRVARAGKDWYVARRYSEFRALHAALEAQLAPDRSRLTCAACDELATFYSSVRFPQRFRLRSALFSKRDIEAARMEALNQYLSLLIETTQGLLHDNDDDDDDDDNNGRKTCEAMALVRDFLMVDENDELSSVCSTATTTEQTPEQADHQLSDKPQPGRCARRSRLRSRSASVSSFRVHELDVLYKEKEPSCVSCVDTLDARLSCDPVLADVFEDFASPPPDAIVQHQRSDDDEQLLSSARLHPLRRSESLCRSRY